MFEYCIYFMILGYFDKTHYDIFYNHESKKAIYLTKEGEDREFVCRMYGKKNLFYIFSEKDEKDKYTQVSEGFLEKHSDMLSLKQSDRINNKWIDIAEGAKNEEDNRNKNNLVNAQNVVCTFLRRILFYFILCIQLVLRFCSIIIRFAQLFFVLLY